MSTVLRIRKSIFLALLIAWTAYCQPLNENLSAPISSKPTSVVVSTVGSFTKGYSWHLSINSARQAHLTIQAFPRTISRQFVVSKQDLDRLIRQILHEQFFDLRSHYGESVAEGSITTMTIVRGHRVKTVSLEFMHPIQTDQKTMKDAARALRVLRTIRSWFSDAEAVNLQEFNDLVIKAAEKGG